MEFSIKKISKRWKLNMIKVKNLTKIYKTPIRKTNLLADIFFRQYKEKTALDNISFEINTNELIGFIGPNGAGKTTTMKILSGILYPTFGEINVLGYFPFDKKPEFLKKISFISGQKNQLFWELPVTESFKLTKEIYQVNDSDYKKSLSNLIDLFNVNKLLKQPVKTLSLGQRMKMELINALLYNPQILFLDEPTIGLDIFSQSAIINFIKKYQKNFKSTIILTSHYLQDVKKLAQRIILINQGKIIYDGSLKKLTDKHSNKKIIKIILDCEIPKNFLEKINQQKISYKNNPPLLEIIIEKNKLSFLIKEVINKLSFQDLTIEDEPIEEIIKNFINNQSKN